MFGFFLCSILYIDRKMQVLNLQISLIIDTRRIDRHDYKLVQQIDKCNYWKSILHQGKSVIVFIANRGLVFWRDKETIGFSQIDNFLWILLARHHQFLFTHIEMHTNKGRCTSFFINNNNGCKGDRIDCWWALLSQIL